MAAKKKRSPKPSVAPSETEAARRARGKIRVQLSLSTEVAEELQRRGEARKAAGDPGGMSAEVEALIRLDL